jgi:subtilisin
MNKNKMNILIRRHAKKEVAVIAAVSTLLSFFPHLLYAQESQLRADPAALIQQLQDQITTLQIKIAALAQQVQEKQTTSQFTQVLQRGMRGDEVRKLQNFLRQSTDVYPDGLVTGYFGPLTEAAVKRFQEIHGIEKVGNIDSQTMDKLNDLIEHGASASGVIPKGLSVAPRPQTTSPRHTTPPSLTELTERVNVLIGFRQTPGLNERALITNQGGSTKRSYHLVPAIAANVPKVAIEALLRNPLITGIDLDGTVRAVDAELDNAWGVKRIDAGVIHGNGNKGTGVKIAVIDSGIDYTHPDLDAKYAGGYDFVNNDSNPMDDHGHGTHVVGIIAAQDNDVGVVGVSPEVKLYALKVLNSQGNGSWSDAIAALEWAVENGIQITNNSYGSREDPGLIVKQAFDNAASAGILHVAAAGNSGSCGGGDDTVEYPARFESVIAVGATTKSDTRPCFSSTGDTIELVAPGVSINSTLNGGGYGTQSGTSMASPHVAGTAALVISAGVSDTNNNGRINDEVRNILTGTAEDLGTSGRDPEYGYGLVDAESAVNIKNAPKPEPLPEQKSAPPAPAPAPEPTPEPAPEPTPTPNKPASVSVSSVAYTSIDPLGKNIKISITLTDNFGNPVRGASVSIQLHRENAMVALVPSGVLVSLGTQATNSSGIVTFALINPPRGCYTTKIVTVSAVGLAWNGASPDNKFCR